jgi:hypothetical protein
VGTGRGGGYLRVVPRHKLADKLGEGLCLNSFSDLTGEPLCVGHIVERNQAGRKRQPRFFCQVVQEGPAVIFAGAAAAILVQGPGNGDSLQTDWLLG